MRKASSDFRAPAAAGVSYETLYKALSAFEADLQEHIHTAWIQAHGRTQIFGRIGTFILGSDFYSIPKLRRLNFFGLFALLCSLGMVDGRSLCWLALRPTFVAEMGRSGGSIRWNCSVKTGPKGNSKEILHQTAHDG